MRSTESRWSALSQAILCLLAVAIGVLYLRDLNSASLSIEEVGHARQVVSLATTGRSLSGQRWPLYVAEPGYPAGREPLWIYASVLLVKVRGFSEAALRLPSALAGVADVLLMFVLARRLFESDLIGLVAALLLALMPAHVIHSRIATSQIGPVLFVLGWLIGLARYVERGRLTDLFLATLCLGIGVYSYLAAAVMLPVFMLATLACAVARYRHDQSWPRAAMAARRDIMVCAAGLLLAFLPWIIWNVANPDRLAQLARYYHNNGYNTDVTSGTGVGTILLSRLNLWWNCLNPEQVFFSGDPSPRYSTREVGYVLLPTLPLLLIGFRGVRRTLPPGFAALVIAGIVLGPLPALLGGDYDLKRWLSVLPFVTIVTASGVRVLAQSPRFVARGALIVIVVLSGVQFADFLKDYQGDYRSRFYFYFGGNLRGAIDNVMATPVSPDCVFLDTRSDIVPSWALYTRARGRPDLATQAHEMKPPFRIQPANGCAVTTFIVLDKEFRVDQIPDATRTPIPEGNGRVWIAVYRLRSQA